MTFFHKTSSTRFWIRLQRHASGHYEALLSGLTCQDVYDCLKEEFDGKHALAALVADLPGANPAAIDAKQTLPCRHQHAKQTHFALGNLVIDQRAGLNHAAADSYE